MASSHTPLKKIGQSLRKPEGPDQMSENNLDERTVQEIEDFEDFEFLELRSSFYSYMHVMTLGIASFTRGYYMCIYNVMGLIWLLDVYEIPAESDRTWWLAGFNTIWMAGAFIGTLVGTWMNNKFGPRISMYSFLGVRIPVTLIYLIEGFWWHF
jgi:MFS family permease